MMNFLIFAGKSTHEYGVMISGEGSYNSPTRKVKKQGVPGKNGDLIFDEGSYENIPISYPAAIITDMPNRFREFVNFAGAKVGYQRLEDTYHPDEFRMARFLSDMEVKTSGYMNDSGEFTLIFDCKPQRFLKEGEIATTFNAAGSLINPTPQVALPYLRIYGTGAGTVGIGPETITITAIDSYVDIDCEVMDAFKGATNCNANVSFTDDIVLNPGSNGIALSGNISRVEITPRWWVI